MFTNINPINLNSNIEECNNDLRFDMHRYIKNWEPKCPDI